MAVLILIPVIGFVLFVLACCKTDWKTRDEQNRQFYADGYHILGASEKQDGYLSGNGYLVTWAFGHLVGLAMPEAYGIQSFRRENLPIIPENFQLTPRQVKAEKGYKADPGALKQLKVIKEVFSQSDKIIVATDAGREGELIFRYIYQYIG